MLGTTLSCIQKQYYLWNSTPTVIMAFSTLCFTYFAAVRYPVLIYIKDFLMSCLLFDGNISLSCLKQEKLPYFSILIELTWLHWIWSINRTMFKVYLYLYLCPSYNNRWNNTMVTLRCDIDFANQFINTIQVNGFCITSW